MLIFFPTSRPSPPFCLRTRTAPADPTLQCFENRGERKIIPWRFSIYIYIIHCANIRVLKIISPNAYNATVCASTPKNLSRCTPPLENRPSTGPFLPPCDANKAVFYPAVDECPAFMRTKVFRLSRPLLYNIYYCTRLYNILLS